jgi:hypothetical protein
VVFEQVANRWIEVMRYQLDAQAEQQIETDASQAAASADSKS